MTKLREDDQKNWTDETLGKARTVIEEKLKAEGLSQYAFLSEKASHLSDDALFIEAIANATNTAIAAAANILIIRAIVSPLSVFILAP